MSNRELLVYYFSGALDDYLDYLKPKGAQINTGQTLSVSYVM